MNQIGITSLVPQALAQAVKEMGQPAFRAKQLFRWLHAKQVSSFSQMTDLPKTWIEQLEQSYAIETLKVRLRQQSKDGTVKYLFALPDGNCIETVLMRYNYGNTVCVSTQVGCRMGCRFCASTQGGRVRNLTAGEIAGEIYAVMQDTSERVSHIVLMGIGEPLDNFDNVMDFLTIMSSPEGVNIGMRNISLSTCGIVPMIEKLAKYHLGLTLSISLHAPTNVMRSKMMPVNDVYPVEKLITACRAYQNQTGRRISFEYSMVKGVNDSEETARKLAALIKGMGAHVNLIPINPVDGSPYSATDAARVKRFQSVLTELGVNATVRRRLGTDISAACGQLRRESATPKKPQENLPLRRNYCLKIVAKTDIGNQRSENQDNYRAGRQADDTVWALVCDGMGGARGGKLASTLVAEYMEKAFIAAIDTLQTDDAICHFLHQSVSEASRIVYETAQKDLAMQGMGTTIVCTVLRGNALHCVHAGDSRAYVYHAGILRQLTRDHSMVQELLEQGSITAQEAEVHPNKNLITRALGVNEKVELDYNRIQIQENDVLLLCTDGLTNCLSDARLTEIVQTTPFDQAANTLIECALDAGGMDNVTVLLVQAQLPEGESNG